MTKVTVTLPGRAYHAALDPRTTQVPVEHGWPVARIRTRGRGVTATYRLTIRQADEMIDHLTMLADGWYGIGPSEDPDTYADRRAVLTAVARIREQLR